MTDRFVRSGGVLVRAAGWAALVVGAASAGYNTTQRFVTPSAAEPSELARLGAAHASVAVEAPAARQIQIAEPAQEIVEREPSVEASHGSLRSSGSAQASGRAAVVPALGARKRTGAVVQPAAEPTEPTTADVELSDVSRAEQIAERVRALDSAAHVAPSAQETTSSAVSAVVESVLREESERRSSEAAAKRIEPAPLRGADVYVKSVPATPRPSNVARAAEPALGPSQPLSAAARIDRLVVRGPLSAAHVRRSVERVRPTLSECYSAAAHQAGRNRFAPVRVQVTIDEAGRIKTLPKIDGAQLPGFGECLSTAMSKLVCQAPDTGTAWASITLGFVPERR